MSAPVVLPHLWKFRGVYYCAVVHRYADGLPARGPDALPMPRVDEPIGTGATLGEAGTVWRLVKHGRRYQSAT